MTLDRRLLTLALAAVLGACVPTQRAVRGQARGTEAWSWRMSATEGRWAKDGVQANASPAAARPATPPEPTSRSAGPAPVADDAEMTLEPDPVAPAKKPKALVARAAKGKRAAPAVVDLQTSDSDEEFVNKIIDDNADAEDGEITMSAMELPKTRAERAAARKKLSAPVVDIEAEPAKTTPARKKHMTRAEKRRAKLMAKLEKKKAKEMAAREARLRGKRARVDEEERQRASSARKARRDKHKGTFFKNGEGFIDDEAAGDGGDDEEAAASDDDDDDDGDDAASGDDDDSGDDEDDGSVVVVSSKKKAKPSAAPAKPAAAVASKPAGKAKAGHVKSDWRGQAVDDEDPLRSAKKK